jgi:DNA-binding transcriptional MerR regulator
MTIYSMADVCRSTGLKRHWITYQIAIGSLPEPQRIGGNRRCFTQEQVENIREFFETRRIEKISKRRSKKEGVQNESAT